MVTAFAFSDLYNNLKNNSIATSNNFAILKLFVPDKNLRELYENKIESHNNMVTNNLFADSGFDLFVPNAVTFDTLFETKFIDMDVKAEMIYCDIETNHTTTCAYNIYPRSSMSKTPLMLANHTGIIDSGYRGSLIGAFRFLGSSNSSNPLQYTVERNTRLLQICHPTLCPIFVILVNESDLSNTERGNGGFGSTGL